MYIIIQIIHPETIRQGIYWLEDLAVVDETTERLLTFETLEQADAYREKHTIDGRIVEVPVMEL